ncbi:MAG: glycosyltransferase family 9 protein [Phycisphaerae bacterium]|nr:glycosyltransferase family 9 protein [Phycisphaerae bacterium]
MSNPLISVKRSHGLGNLVCLVPVLEKLHRQGQAVRVLTRGEWVEPFSVMYGQFVWVEGEDSGAVDLDELTRELVPVEHRTDEFGRLLGVDGPFDSPRLSVAKGWSEKYEHLRGSLVLAPEGGHPSRTWAYEKANQLREHLGGEKLVVLGVDRGYEVQADVDFRGGLSVCDLLGVLSVAGVVITMDSGVLHLAAGIGRPTVAVFGGVNPRYRVRDDQKVVVVQSKLECCPCDKNEICNEEFWCINSVAVGDVVGAIEMAREAEGMRVVRV